MDINGMKAKIKELESRVLELNKEKVELIDARLEMAFHFCSLILKAEDLSKLQRGVRGKVNSIMGELSSK